MSHKRLCSEWIKMNFKEWAKKYYSDEDKETLHKMSHAWASGHVNMAKRCDELQDFCIWLTGCGYDFCQHDYFIEQRDKLLKEPPEHPLKGLADNQKDMPPEFSKVVDDNFFDLV
jgi:hypothetical protein